MRPGSRKTIGISIGETRVKVLGESGPSARGVPQKGTNKEYKDFLPSFSLKNRVLKLRFLAFSEGPGGFRELPEAGRNHFHLSW